ncbi:hypothetical protein [Xinfangfangia pollutisoli]|uniref:hypothetical protein n=1 Tax=Xinfangfangia pollutisoli TaxID=2865960 RepID=UPI001CD28A76|nr:hypothetical protein [Xinfangfangia pollutisoli]
MTTAYNQLFYAFREARSALDALRPRAWSTDAALARDPDYHRLHRSGMVIARIGGGEAIDGAIDALSDNDQCAADLRRYWAGMDQWPSTQRH